MRDNFQLWSRLEEISLNSWPAFQTRLYEGWLLRFADGYSKRSNCIVPLFDQQQQPASKEELHYKIKFCERLYAEQQQDFIYKILSFTPPELDQTLEEQGYERVDSVHVKTVDLSGLPETMATDCQFSLYEYYKEEWMEQYARMSSLPDSRRPAAVKLLQTMPSPKCFLTIYLDGEPAACGAAVIEAGWVGLYDIVTDERFRKRGLGEQVVRKLLTWGRKNGADNGYLMVLQHNWPANRLYDKIGFKREYDHWYRVKKRNG